MLGLCSCGFYGFEKWLELELLLMLGVVGRGLGYKKRAFLGRSALFNG